MNLTKSTLSILATAVLSMGIGVFASGYVLSQRITEIEYVDIENKLRIFTGLAKKCGEACEPIRGDLRSIISIRMQQAEDISYHEHSDVLRLDALKREAASVVDGLK